VLAISYLNLIKQMSQPVLFLLSVYEYSLTITVINKTRNSVGSKTYTLLYKYVLLKLFNTTCCFVADKGLNIGTHGFTKMGLTRWV